MSSPLVLSVFTLFDENNPQFLEPLGRPNPRLVGNGESEKNLVYRIALTNLTGEQYGPVAGEFVGSVGNVAGVWPVESLTIPPGGTYFLQGLSPGVNGGAGVLNVLGMEGSINLRTVWREGGDVQVESTMPLFIDQTDLRAGGAEQYGPPDTIITNRPATRAELDARIARRDYLVDTIAVSQDELHEIQPRIAQLKEALG